MLQAEDIVKMLDLAPLPEEGGMYRQTYASGETASGGPAATAIYFMLTENSYSHLHRLPADEVYHHYMGGPVELTLIDNSGKLTKITLGKDLAAGQVPQVVAPKGTWQGSRLAPGGAYALLGTTMAPGFTADMYEHADADALCGQYPQLAEEIRALTGETKFM